MTERLDVASRLADALHDVSPSADLPARIVQRTHQRRARRKALRTGTVVTAAVVVVLGALAVASSDKRRDDSLVTDESESSAVFRWEVLPDAPIPNRATAAVVWTGTEVVVWGGGPGSGSSRDGLRADGAAFDPAAGRWRALAPAPIGPRGEPVAVWTGTEMIVWGGWRPLAGREESPTWTDGAAYDPASDTWRRITEPPEGIRLTGPYAWTGEELVVLGGGSDQHAMGAAYHPGRNSWRLLPPLGLHMDSGGWAEWTGREVLYWRPMGDVALGSPTPPTPRLFAYNPATDTWRTAADPAERFHLDWDGAAVAWAGTRLVVASGAGSDKEPTAELEAIAYDPQADSWQRVVRTENRNMFVPHSNAVRTGHEILTIDRHGYAVSALDPRTGTWIDVPDGPEGLFRGTVVVADGDVYVFGDERSARLVRDERRR